MLDGEVHRIFATRSTPSWEWLLLGVVTDGHGVTGDGTVLSFDWHVLRRDAATVQPPNRS